MQLRSNIFLWVFLATVVPLTALALGATYFSQHDYEREVYREVNTSLESLAAEMERQLAAQREAVQGLARAPAMRDLLPVLAGLANGPLPEDAEARVQRVNRFFEEVQTSFSGLGTLRVLDAQGDTLVKSRDGRSTPALYESLEGLRYAEPELNDPRFARRLQAAPEGEVSFVLLPHRRLDDARAARITLYDYLLPLVADGRVVGALAATPAGGQLDRIVNHATRLYQGRVFIAEVNPDHPARHGLLLYDDPHELHFDQVRAQMPTVQSTYGKPLWRRLGPLPDGVVRGAAEHTSAFYVEVQPYPSLLVNWLLTMQVNDDIINAPFNRIRFAIWVFAAFALVVSLALANVAARRIAQPVCRLAQSLKAFAHGERPAPLHAQRIDEIAELGESFNYMAETLERAREERDRAHHMMLQNAKLASIGQMAAGIGHEINNPLNNILSLTKLLQRGMPGADVRARRDLRSLREEALRASEIVKGVLNFARQVPPAYDRFEVRPWVEDSLKLVRQQAASAGVGLECDCPGELALEGDRSQLQQALINLLLNAIHASARGRCVRVQARRAGDRARIAVCDEGVGIAPEALDRIFDPFFTTKEVGHGSGLGLSISLGIVEHHGGQLDIVNAPGGGVTATMTLPLQQAGREGAAPRPTGTAHGG